MGCRRKTDDESLRRIGGTPLKVDLGRYVNRHGGKARRLLWEVVWCLFAATTPRWMLQGWRRFLLRLFGAKIGGGVQIHGGAHVWMPRQLEVGENSWVGRDANLYCVAPIKIGANAVVSEGAFICTAEHDISSVKFELKTAPISIGDMAWIGAGAMVLPGRKVGEGAVVAAYSVVTHDVEPWTVVAGNPARFVKKRRVEDLRPDLSVVILAQNEELHLGRCLEKLKPLNAKEIIVVDSGSTDATERIAKEMGARFVYNQWPGTQAKQFNWALDNVEINGKWILRLDADEYLLPGLVEEIKDALCLGEPGFDGAVFKRRHIVGWLGDTWVKRGMYPVKMLRLFRKGKGRSNLREMDEHIEVDGKVVEFANDFVDHSLISKKEWIEKHRAYAKREAVQWATGDWGNKAFYYRMPGCFRAAFYWLVRMFVKGAVLEGPKAWSWCWNHALRYRWLCDREIAKIEKMRRRKTK